MKNIKLILFATVIIIIAIVILIFIILYNNGGKKDTKLQIEQQSTQDIQKSFVKTNEVTNSAMYFTIKSCIDTYMKYISEQNNEAVYGVLAQDYIIENNISVSNVLNYVKTLEGNNIDFSIREMRVSNEGKELQTYYVDGIIRDNNNNKKQSKLTVNIDITNKVFNIIPTVIEGVFDE